MNINPDINLAMYMSTLTKNELKEIMKECNKILKKKEKEEKKEKIEKNRSICEILFDY